MKLIIGIIIGIVVTVIFVVLMSAFIVSGRLSEVDDDE